MTKHELNEELRTQWKAQQEKYGTPIVFFAHKIGFSKTTVRRWMEGSFDFSIGSALVVQEYLNQ